MIINEILNQQAIQESQQSTGTKTVSSDNAFATLLQSEISGPQSETAPVVQFASPGAYPVPWGFSP